METEKLLVIGTAVKPRIIKNISLHNLSLTWKSKTKLFFKVDENFSREKYVDKLFPQHQIPLKYKNSLTMNLT